MATVIFKPTEECNARCVYCDVVKKETRGPKRMGLDMLELFFERVGEFLRDRPSEEMNVIWHGGEPLLLGPQYFEHALRFQEKHCGDNQHRIRHDVQSNLTLLKRHHLPPLKKLGITRVGSSYDPTPRVRGIGPRVDSRSYNSRFIDAVNLLDDEGIAWSIIYVATRQSLAEPERIFNLLSNLSPNGSFKINPVVVYGPGLDHIRISPEEYTEFLGLIFPLWWKRRYNSAQVEPFDSLVRALTSNERPMVCCDAGTCAYTHLDVLPDGSVSHCGRSADWGLLDYGSLRDRSFSEIFADPQREALAGRNDMLSQTECRDCRFWSICHGGCPLDGWTAGDDVFHKTAWCHAKRGFIEQYVEPVLRAAGASSSAGEERGPVGIRSGIVAPPIVDDAPLWINPIGGLGDAVMISSVLKQVSDRFPARKFNLVERTKYREILAGHPAIAQIGYPPHDARFVSTDYWHHPDRTKPGARAYQILARIFGLEPPVEECLYVPWELTDDPLLVSCIPWQTNNVLICPSSDSPRKQMPTAKWEALVALLRKDGVGVVQAGRLRDRYVSGAHSLLGMTTPRQIVSLLSRFDAVVTSDNFIMHAARMRSIPAVVLWGPTDHRVYGYDGQIHLQAKISCGLEGGCIGPDQPFDYHTECPHDRAHCMSGHDPKTIRDAIVRIIASNEGCRLVKDPALKSGTGLCA